MVATVLGTSAAVDEECWTCKAIKYKAELVNRPKYTAEVTHQSTRKGDFMETILKKQIN